MSRIFRSKKRALLGVVAALAIATAAMAYWTASGGGDGTGTVKATNGEVVLKGTIDDPLAPGLDSDVTIKAWNTGETDLYVTSTTLDNIQAVEDASATGTCDDGDFSESNGGTVAQGTVIPHGTDETTAVSLSAHNIEFANSASNQDDCKSADITFDLSSD